MSVPRFGPWVVERPIGRGAFGTVYRCHREDAPGALAALKVLHRPQGAPNLVRRLAREARVLARLDHPGAVRILGEDLEAAEPWLALALVDGQPLDRARPGKRPPAEVEALALALADVLRHAHGLGVWHRDIKPANVLVERSGAVRIVDFGISAAIEESTLTEPGAAGPGTVDYAPPEWFAGGKPDPAKHDAYGLGVLLWEQLRGERAFSAAGARLSRVLQQKAETPALDPGDVGPLRELVIGLTAKDPRQRLGVEDVAARLAPRAVAAPTFVRVTAPADTFVGTPLELGAVRLTSVFGPPGVGKSRHAREALRGGAWVELADRSGPEELARAVALAFPAGLAGHRGAVLLDDADGVLPALRAELAGWLRSAPEARFVVTSRERLRVSGERGVPVAPLAPAAAAELVRARLREAGRPAPDPARLAALVAASDGLPLALELAAAGADPAGGALADAWRTLAPEEQRVWAACSVFRGPFGLALAEEVIGGERLFETLQDLVGRSLLEVRRGEGAFRMLRALREAARGRLAERGEAEEIALRHAYAAARAVELAPSPATRDDAAAALDWARARGDEELIDALVRGLGRP